MYLACKVVSLLLDINHWKGQQESYRENTLVGPFSHSLPAECRNNPLQKPPLNHPLPQLRSPFSPASPNSSLLLQPLLFPPQFFLQPP